MPAARAAAAARSWARAGASAASTISPSSADGDRSARVGQVHAGAERRGGSGGDGAHPRGTAAVAGDAGRKDESHRGQRAFRVPVRDRLLEATACGVRPGQLHDPRKQPAGQAVDDHDGDPGGQGRLDGRDGARRPQHADRHHERAGVQQQPLDVLDRWPAERRPGDRHGRPCRHQHEPGQREPAWQAAWQRYRAGDRQGEHERPDHDRREHPRLREVAAGVEGEHGRRREDRGRGDGGHGATHGAPG